MHSIKSRKEKHNLLKWKVLPLIIIFVSSYIAAWIFIDQITPTSSGWYIRPVFVNNREGVVRVKDGTLVISDNEITIFLEGELTLSNSGRSVKSIKVLNSDDIVSFGFDALVLTTNSFSNYGKLISNANEENPNNYLCINRLEKYSIRERGGYGYEYVTEVPIEEMPEEYTHFKIEIHFDLPEFTDDMYMHIDPQFFEENADELRSFRTFRLLIPADKYYFKELSCDARINLIRDTENQRLYAEWSSERNQDFSIHVGKKESKISPYIFAVSISIVGITVAVMQHSSTSESTEKIQREIQRTSEEIKAILWQNREKNQKKELKNRYRRR